METQYCFIPIPINASGIYLKDEEHDRIILAGIGQTPLAQKIWI